MTLLVDTHIFVWAAQADDRLPPAARELVADPGNERLLSVASTWEIAIKVRSGRWTQAAGLLASLDQAIDDLALTVAPIDLVDSVRAGPLSWDHRDPFDRMIAAQAILRDVEVVTVDRDFGDAGCRLALADRRS